MKQFEFAVSIVLVLIASLALTAQAQPSIQRINETMIPRDADQLPVTLEGQIPQAPFQDIAMQPDMGVAIVDIAGIKINSSGNVTFFLTTPTWVSVRNQPSVLYFPLSQSDENPLIRQKMYDLLFYAYSNKLDVSIGYYRSSKEIQSVELE